MNKRIFVSGIAIIVFFALIISCNKNNNSTPQATTGSVVFYTNQDCGVGDFTITCNDSAKTLAHFFPSSVPSCGDQYAPTFTMTPGTYNFTVSASKGSSNGSITIQAGVCMQQLILCGGTTTGTGCNTYSLNGTWKRQADGVCSGSTGMIVYFSGTTGTIQSTPSNSCGFSAGQIKWQNLNTTTCTMDDLNMPSNTFQNYSISFTDANTFNVGSLTYKRQ